MDNKANSVLEIENAYQREMQAEIMNDIDNDLKDYFDTNKLFSQMQSAFGEQADSKKPTSLNQATADYLKKQKQKKSKANNTSATLTAADMNASNSLSSSMLAKTALVAKNELLDPIIEEGVTGGALALYKPGASSVAAVEERAKKNEALKKRVKMATGGSIGSTSISSLSDASAINGSKASFTNNPSSETDTFITGTKL